MPDIASIAGSAAVAAIVTTGGSLHAARQSRHAAASKVDAEAYARAREMDKDIVKALQTEISRLRTELSETRRELEEEERKNQLLVQRMRECEYRLDRCVRMLSRLGQKIPE